MLLPQNRADAPKLVQIAPAGTGGTPLRPALRRATNAVGNFFAAIDLADAVGLILGVVAGLGLLGYVTINWVMHFFQQGHFAIGVVAACAWLVMVALALARSPVFMVLVFGSAIVCTVAFFGGHARLLMP